jgi:hypothetical protein
MWSQEATGNVLYFLHCDSFPPYFGRIINDAVQKEIMRDVSE